MQYHIVNAFSLNGKGGNPAAVVINSNYNNEEKQQVAKQIGVSETAFVQANKDQLFIEFYTPEKPITYCGHATIASVNILRQQGIIAEGNYLLGTKENPIVVDVAADKVYMHQLFPGFEKIDKAEVAKSLSINHVHLVDAVIARNGVGFVLAELDSDEYLYQLTPNQDLIYDYSEKNDLVGLYLFVRKQGKILSRMFAPYFGIPEENATGMAAGLAGGWLNDRYAIKEIAIEQGYTGEMKGRGYLHVQIDNDNGIRIVKVGGEAVILKSENLEVAAF